MIFRKIPRHFPVKPNRMRTRLLQNLGQKHPRLSLWQSVPEEISLRALSFHVMQHYSASIGKVFMRSAIS